MMVPAGPRATLKVIEAKFVFELAVVLLDAPAPFGEAHEAPEAERLAWQVGEPIRDRRGVVTRPFEQQLHGRRREGAGVPDTVRGPAGGLRKARPQRAPRARAPRDRAPGRGRQRLRQGRAVGPGATVQPLTLGATCTQ